jgi:protein-tyrosine-phosphatase
MKEYVKKYFDSISTNLQNHLRNNDLSPEEKEKINIRLELINELKYNITWQFKTEEQKQVSRLQWLATMRRSDMPSCFIHKQEKVIHIYEQIKLTLPYLEALNSNLLKTTIIDFVNDLCEKIDLAGQEYKKDFPINIEIEQLFKPYFEITKPAKGNGSMFEECYEKIENLYNELMKLNETA